MQSPVATASTRFLQRLKWHTGEWPTKQETKLLSVLSQRRPSPPNKSCNHPCKSGARCTDRCIQSEKMCSKKDPPPKKLNFLRFLGPSQHIPSPLVCKVGPAGVPWKTPSTTEHRSLSTLLLGGRGKHVTQQNIKKLSFLVGWPLESNAFLLLWPESWLVWMTVCFKRFHDWFVMPYRSHVLHWWLNDLHEGGHACSIVNHCKQLRSSVSCFVGRSPVCHLSLCRNRVEAVATL